MDDYASIIARLELGPIDNELLKTAATLIKTLLLERDEARSKLRSLTIELEDIYDSYKR